MSLRSVRRRNRLSMTSLIDVIFLLLLFFMLSSTFSRFAEIELQTGGTGHGGGPQSGQTFFVRITDAGLSFNGQPVAPDDLAAMFSDTAGAATVLISVTQEAPSQALADVLVTLRPLPDLNISVLGAL